MKTIAVCAAQVPFFSGGAETHVSGLMRELQKRGFDVDLINIPYKWYPHEQLMKSIQFWKMLDLSESDGKKIDMVIATKFPSYFVQHPNKVLWLIHQYRQMYDLFESPYSGFDKKSRKDMALRDKLINMDNQVLGTYKRIYTNSGNTANRLKKFNNIESVPLYHPPKLAGLYYSANFDDYILSVGRLDPLKRVDLLIRALPFCDSRIRCKIAGHGPELENLRILSQELCVADRIEFLGFVSDKKLLDLYANCSAVFFAPKDEDYGYITLEAFLSKKPVLTSYDAGGPLEFVKDNSNGIIFGSLNAGEIGKKIDELVLNKDRCRNYGLNGYQKVKDINWDFVIQTLLFGQRR
ncbi:MAG: glycosyltransferase family 4 protein [Candidatus Aminicenantes bacterium]|nr:glycosyltransferase family 4 protein [Candidatus Aminicenantes bacterium]